MKAIILISIVVMTSGCQLNSVKDKQNNFLKMETINKPNIDSLMILEDHLSAILELYNYVSLISDYGENIKELNHTQKLILWIESLEMEVNNGGFHQFFLNSSGDYSKETLDALEEIEAHKTLEIFKDVISEWPNSNVPKNRAERMNVLDQIEENAEEKWDECDSRFYNNEDDITELLWQYVNENKKGL